MIRPPLPRVKNEDVLGLGLMNGIINRVEYAADLLRQGRPLAGDAINIEENYAGTIISYNPTEDRGEVLCGYYQKSQAEGIIGFIYRNGIFIDLPSPSIGGAFDDSYYGISENRVCGSIFIGFPDTYGFIYYNNQYLYYRFKGDKYTEFFSIRKNQVVGFTEDDSIPISTERQRGLYFNTITGEQISEIFPYSSFGLSGFKTSFQDIYENKIIGDYSYIKTGGQETSIGGFIYESGQWQQLNYPESFLSSSLTIYGDKIFGIYTNSFNDSAKIYMYENGQFTTNQLLTDIGASYLKLKNNRLAGTMIDPDDGIRKGFVYDIDSGQLTKIQHPLATITGTYITGID